MVDIKESIKNFFKKPFIYFCILCAFICHLVYIFAFGYTYVPGQTKEGLEIGSIYLSSVPKGASIDVGGKRYSLKTPVQIDNLLPGFYKLNITLPGYKPWPRTVRVGAGTVSVIDKILFPPNTWRKRVVLRDSFENLISLPKSRLFILTQGARLSEHSIYDPKLGSRVDLSRDYPHLASAVVKDVFTMPGSSALVFYVSLKGKPALIWAKYTEGAITLSDISGIINFNSFDLKWDIDASNYVFCLQNNYINRLYINERVVHPKYFQDISSYNLFGGLVYMITPSKLVVVSDYAKTGKQDLVGDTILGGVLFKEKGKFDIRPLTRSIVLFLSQKGGLFSNHAPHTIVTSGVRGIDTDPATRSITFWQARGLGVIDFRVEQVQAEWQKAPKSSWIYTKAKDIKQGFWVYDGSHIIFRDRDDVFLIERNTLRAKTFEYVTEVKTATDVQYVEEIGALFYLDSSTGNLSLIQVIPRRLEQRKGFILSNYLRK